MLLSIGFSKDIVVLWRKNFAKISPLSYFKYALYLVISSSKLDHWILLIIYNAQSDLLQKEL